VIEMSLGEVANAVGGSLHGSSPPSQLAPDSVSIDTRTLRPGEMFVAIRGDRFDGHDFIQEALGKGAALMLTSKTDPGWNDSMQPGCNLIVVPDTLAALQQLASHARRKWGRPLLAVSGSMGKTTTRHFAARLLSEKFRVLETPGNLNNEIGLPLSLLGLKAGHDLAVLELGMNRAGEIRRLGAICAPTAALLTNIAPVHLEFFDGVDDIAKAKGEILESLSEDGVFFFNCDDARLVRLADAFEGKRISFGFSKQAAVGVERFQFRDLGSTEVTLRTWAGPLQGMVPFAGRHFLYNLAAAVAVALEFGVSADRIENAMPALAPLEGRGRLLNGPGFDVWDDCYNSNPAAVESLLETLGLIERKGRILLALGDMLELGKQAEEMHRDAGRRISSTRIDLLIAVGSMARHIAEGARMRGFPEDRVLEFETSQDSAARIRSLLQPGDLLVVKGSRGVRMEKIVEAALASRDESREAKK
jgi:UDP-N-acetylmuramoyl-tripeptide--D-alanyl-D-alanine ligase